jgi:hypothetical protein
VLSSGADGSVTWVGGTDGAGTDAALVWGSLGSVVGSGIGTTGIETLEVGPDGVLALGSGTSGTV